MSAGKIADLSKLCIHTITTKHWSIEEAAENYSKAGVKGISVWRQFLEGRNIARTGKMLRDHDLEVVSLVRGGFFPSTSSDTSNKALAANKEANEEANDLGRTGSTQCRERECQNV